MDNSLKVQSYIFLTLVYGGLLVGLVYDLYRVFRYFLKPKKIATIIEDVLFWFIVTIVVFFVLIESTWGELRGYIFVGLFIGVFLYFKFLSKIIYPLLIKLFKLIISTLAIPFNQVKKIIKPFTGKIKKTNKLLKEMGRDTKKYISIISRKK